MIGFIINLPYTLLFIFVSLISFPQHITFDKRNYTVIIHVKSFWWVFGYMKKARAMTFGHTILLGQKLKSTDLAHELIHVKQFNTMPVIFPLFYLFFLIKNGHRNNKYEIEAYRLSGGKLKY